MTSIKLVSEEDSSINYVVPSSDGGYFESRFVQRSSDYFIIYLSSHSGCNQACRMCHLTQTKQTMMTPATLDDYVNQAKQVLSNVSLPFLRALGLTRVKFSFMARGEPLLNPTIVNDWQALRRSLKELIHPYYDVEFSISTIMPNDFKSNLGDIFTNRDVSIYYSIYSVNEDFRKKWLGNAMPYRTALSYLNHYKSLDYGKVKFHSAFIKDENDSEKDIRDLKFALDFNYDNNYKFNIVRYNPYSPKQGEESSNLSLIEEVLEAKIITRVGKDVKASCGMFVKGI